MCRLYNLHILSYSPIALGQLEPKTGKNIHWMVIKTPHAEHLFIKLLNYRLLVISTHLLDVSLCSMQEGAKRGKTEQRNQMELSPEIFFFYH